MLHNSGYSSVADPGFPVEGGREPHTEGAWTPEAVTLDFVCRKERIWTLGGHVPGTPPRSTNAVVFLISFLFWSQPLQSLIQDQCTTLFGAIGIPILDLGHI